MLVSSSRGRVSEQLCPAIPPRHTHATTGFIQMVVILSLALMPTERSNAETLLYNNPMNESSEWSIFGEAQGMNFSFDSGILNTWGTNTSTGSMVFTHRVDTTSFKDIRLEFDYRSAGSIDLWENSDFIQFIVYEQATTLIDGDPVVATSEVWRNKPPSTWTTRSFIMDDITASNTSDLWVGIHTRTTQSGEKIQLNDFRVFGTVVPEPSTALSVLTLAVAGIGKRGLVPRLQDR